MERRSKVRLWTYLSYWCLLEQWLFKSAQEDIRSDRSPSELRLTRRAKSDSFHVRFHDEALQKRATFEEAPQQRATHEEVPHERASNEKKIQVIFRMLREIIRRGVSLLMGDRNGSWENWRAFNPFNTWTDHVRMFYGRNRIKSLFSLCSIEFNYRCLPSSLLCDKVLYEFIAATNV